MALTVRNPATGETLAELPEATREDVLAAVARARAAQPAWAARPVRDRLAALDRFRALLLADRRGMAEQVTRETGKPLTEALGVDVLITLDAAAWVVRNAEKVLAPEVLRLGNPLFVGRVSRVEREPLGVVGVVSPWNYPLAIPASNALHALAAGNAVVLKPASLAPLTALRMARLFHEAGVPGDVLQVVVGSGRVAGEALVDADLDHLVFTGSVPVGKAVEQRLRERGVSSCMELGGSDPALVLHDAPCEDAVRGVVWGRFTNAGETCAAPKRAYVHRSLLDRFVADATRAAAALRLGDPMRPDTDVGPLTDPDGVREMAAFVEDAVKRGARVLCGGKPRPDLGPQWFEPTVLVDVPPDARVVTEEAFGPILPIVPFDDEDEAVRLANGTPFGLSASIWTRDLERGQALARRLHAGTVTLNDVAYTYAANETPWGGVKDSGHGRTHGRWGLLEMTRMRHVNVVPPSRPLGGTWWFPYTPALRELFDQGARFLYGGAGDKARTGAGVAARLLKRRRPDR
ncbi:MAG TPA: aldehyde dehydrogenase family protein [Candidatus Thermoplasmatota archaeon]|nr:aldehyde dehydrogenase family protein [Candidatus Thermoplasmatota archaeon]